MKACIITFRSITPAQRGEGVLKRAGVDCNIQRTSRWMEAQGCGYSLRLKEQDAMAAAALLQQAQVPYRKVYRQMQEGKLEEMHL